MMRVFTVQEDFLINVDNIDYVTIEKLSVIVYFRGGNKIELGCKSGYEVSKMMNMIRKEMELTK